MPYETILNVDLTKAIPLEIGGDNSPSSSCFAIKLSGSILKNDYSVFFDTGSWSTNISYSKLNKDKINIIERNVRNEWPNGSGENCLCDLVSGSIVLMSSDDNTPYTLDNFKFYALHEGEKISGLYDSMIGGFPSVQKSNDMKSLTYALAQKYAGTSGKGVGIMSARGCDGDNLSGLTNIQLYLKIGLDNSFDDQIYWQSNIPMQPNFGGKDFSPEAIPDFAVSFQFEKAREIFSDPQNRNLIATVDTGASELRLILDGGIDDFPDEFDNTGALKPGRGVYIVFKDQFNQQIMYSYTSSNEMSATRVLPLTKAFYGKPANRFCLGNSVYWNSYTYFWDLTSKRVGLRFFGSIEPVIKQGVLKSGQTLQSGEKMFSPDGSCYLIMQEDGNLCLKKTEGDVFVWSMEADPKNLKKGAICSMQPDGNLNVSANNEYVWSAFTQFSQLTKNAFLKITNDGKIQIIAPDRNLKWQKP